MQIRIQITKYRSKKIQRQLTDREYKLQMKAQSGKTTCLSCKAQKEIKVSGCKYHKYRPDRNIEMQAQKKHHLEWEKPKDI